MTHYNPSVRVGQYQFSTGLYFLVFVVFSVTLCFVLSVWQWQRGTAANERYLLQQEKNTHAAIELPLEPKEYQRVNVSGEVTAHYLLDNRTQNREAGREVLVELELDLENLPFDRVLVNVGWQPRGSDLSLAYTLPESLSVIGMTKFPKAGFLLQDPLLDPSWPSLLQDVDLSLLGDRQQHDYYPAVVYSQSPVSTWPLPMVRFKNKYHMHLGYALQWGLIGIACLLLFMKISTNRIDDDNQQKLAA